MEKVLRKRYKGNNNLENISYFIAILLILFISFSPIVKVFRIEMIAYILLLILSFFSTSLKKFNRQQILIMFAIIIIIFFRDLYTTIFFDNREIDMMFCIRMGTIFFYMASVNKLKFYKILEKTIFIFASIGLFMHILIFFEISLPFQKININNNEYFHFFGLFGYYKNMLYRNSGFAWEPSAWSILLGTLLFFRLVKGKVFNLFNLILVLNMITSYSTTGYLLVLFNIIYLLLKNISIKKIFLGITLLILISFNNSFKEIVFKKIFERNSYVALTHNVYGVYSSSARELHKKVDLEIFKDNFLLGSTELTKELRKKYVIKLSLDNRIARYFLVNNKEYYISSNGITYMLARYGIIIFLLYFYLYFEKSIKGINLEKMAYIIIMIFVFSVQGANLLPYFMMLIYIQHILIKTLPKYKKSINYKTKNY